MMRLGIYVDSWLGQTRVGVDLPATEWSWSETWPAIPAGRLTCGFQPDLYPFELDDALRPMGQVLRVELTIGDESPVALPPLRITEASEGVSVTADSIDLSIVEDPFAVPSSPRTGASLAQEVARLAEPLRTAVMVPAYVLPVGVTWPGDRDKALLELVASRSARLQLDQDGTLVVVPLGSVSEPERTYESARIIEAPQKATRSRISKATAVVPETADAPARVLSRRLTDPAYAADLYGTVGKVETLAAGATAAEQEAAVASILAEGGGERQFTITPDPTLRAGMVARFHVDRRDGGETVVGRVTAMTIKSDGTHTVTVQEA